MTSRRSNAPAFTVTWMALIGALVTGAGLADPLFSQTNGNTANGSVQRIKVHGKSLEGNLAGESADPDVTIYLPPSYASERNRRYPVIYLLHGYGGTDQTWTGRIAKLPEIADKVIATKAAREMIVVMPNAFSTYRGSMYSNSVTAGNWEGFLADDLVAYMDKNYRTIPDRLSRGLAGHSMGGYGTIRLGMKRPDAFSSIYALSACCLNANVNPQADRLAASEAFRTKDDLAKAGRGFGLVTLAQAAAWSPNPKNPPFYFDLPTQDGKLQPGVVAKWAANAPLAMLDQYVPSLKKLHAIAVDIGNQDGLLPANNELDQLLTQFDIPHVYERYEGDHTNKIAERIELKVLPFFSNTLSFTRK